ncbi:MAG: signal peptidase II [Clostridia bacterium]|nr:signal peptidase II [Clostridia bacterium]
MFLWIAIMVLVIFLDQLTKYLTILFLKPIPTFPIIEDIIHLTYVENTGAAFGMMKNQRWLFMIVSTVAIIALLVYLFKKKTQPKIENLSIAFIVGGGIGNMIDRIFLGYVVDMIDFRLINFAVFNVADSFVCVGAGLLMLYIILTCIQEYKEEKAKKLALAEGEDLTCDDAAEASVEESVEETVETPEEALEELPESPLEDEDHE